MSECNLTLSTLHHQGQPGVDVVTRLLGLRGHRYAVEVTGLSIGLKIKRGMKDEDALRPLLMSGDSLEETIRNGIFFFVVGDPPDEYFIRSVYLSQQSVLGNLPPVVTYGIARYDTYCMPEAEKLRIERSSRGAESRPPALVAPRIQKHPTRISVAVGFILSSLG